LHYIQSRYRESTRHSQMSVTWNSHNAMPVYCNGPYMLENLALSALTETS